MWLACPRKSKAAQVLALPAALDVGVLPYTLVRTRRKTVALVVEKGGGLVVRAPLHTPRRLIEGFILQKQAWIRARQAEMAKVAGEVTQFINGGLFYFQGQKYPLKVRPVNAGQEECRRLIFQNNQFILGEEMLPRARDLFTAWYKTQARNFMAERAAFFARLYGLKFQKIRISSARTRWGSCSSRGSLSFSWRLVLAPPEVIDYVVIHELAHLKIRNHSRAFWSEVSRMMPVYAQHIAWLKENGRYLNLD